MNTNSFIEIVKEKANTWLNDNIDEESAQEIKRMLNEEIEALIEAFYKDLEFGTGGLRGIMGIGSNRMNKYTVGMSTQGLANYLKQIFKKQIAVAIAYDSRNNSEFFAKTAANVLTANGIKVFIFDELRPTPELSFAVRYLNCQAGIVVTASHNPKEYNGYKVYWDDGAQIVSPHDKNIINEVRKISKISQVNFKGNSNLIQTIGQDIDEAYIAALKTISLNSDIIKEQANMPIVYTPIHGSGLKLVPMALKAFGFNNIHLVEAQNNADGNFPTVKYPNPEEAEALEMALNLAKQINAEIVLGTDPDTDRVGVIARNAKGEYEILNGNQAASLIIWYLLSQWKKKDKLKGNEFIAKTIVTSDLLAEIAESFGVKYYDVLTGFKYIAEVIRNKEGQEKFIGGGEESYGYLIGDFVRDKDAVGSCAILAEISAWAKANNKTLPDILKEIYRDYSFYKESLVSITKTGKAGAEEIKNMMVNYRNNPPESIAGEDVTVIHDFEKQISFDMISQLRYGISLPKSNVLQFELKNGSKISIRPSGTEPKIKYYFSVKAKMQSIEDYDKINQELENMIEQIKKEII
ncbi:MAG: phospho-sugar mutase [Bacteroidales bacterium]|nr:phospho-sugar mutase [Bacteroidales bacterium]